MARVIPAPIWHAISRRIGLIAWLFAGARRRTLDTNVAYLAPQLGIAARRRLGRETLVNFFEAAADLFRLPSMRPGELEELVSAEGVEHVRAALAMGRGVIGTTAHLGPYEMGGAFLAKIGVPVHAMVEDIDAETNAALASYRTASGMELISRNTGLRQTYRVLKQGGMVLLVADRVIGAGGDGVEVAWCSGRRTVPSGPAALSLATGAPIVVGYIVRRPAGAGTRYLVHFDAPIVAAGRTRDELTRDVAARLAAAVCQHPDQWYVFQPDWLPRDAGS